MSVHASIVIAADQWFEVHTQSGPPEADFPDGYGIAAVRIGKQFGEAITIQGDPEAMVALFDRIRSELVLACGREWPVEAAHGDIWDDLAEGVSA